MAILYVINPNPASAILWVERNPRKERKDKAKDFRSKLQRMTHE